MQVPLCNDLDLEVHVDGEKQLSEIIEYTKTPFHQIKFNNAKEMVSKAILNFKGKINAIGRQAKTLELLTPVKLRIKFWQQDDILQTLVRGNCVVFCSLYKRQ